jgi:hypothetical protein
MLPQQIFGVACGHEDGNDAARPQPAVKSVPECRLLEQCRQ